MLDKIKGFFRLDKIKGFFRREPLVVINTLGTLAYGVWVEATSGLDASAGWKAVGVAVLTALARRFVTPVAKTPEPQEFRDKIHLS